MTVLRLAFVSSLVVTVGLVTQACASDDKAIPTASCSTSAQKLTIGDCVTLGRASGCNASRDDGAGGCQFEGCDSPPVVHAARRQHERRGEGRRRS